MYTSTVHILIHPQLFVNELQPPEIQRLYSSFPTYISGCSDNYVKSARIHYKKIKINKIRMRGKCKLKR
jgi:hypothetical protein